MGDGFYRSIKTQPTVSKYWRRSPPTPRLWSVLYRNVWRTYSEEPVRQYIRYIVSARESCSLHANAARSDMAVQTHHYSGQ